MSAWTVAAEVLLGIAVAALSGGLLIQSFVIQDLQGEIRALDARLDVHEEARR